jgi:Zn finger protein HypA/HybF involved in hydrogenase expression
MDCDCCGETVADTWKWQKRSAQMTYRRVEWWCADCHPNVTVSAAPERTGKQPVTDGGQPAIGACPTCTGETVDGQGLHQCVDCGWVGTV